MINSQITNVHADENKLTIHVLTFDNDLDIYLSDPKPAHFKAYVFMTEDEYFTKMENIGFFTEINKMVVNHIVV